MQEADSKEFFTLFGGSVGIPCKPWSSDGISNSKDAVCRFLVVANFEQTARAGAPNPGACHTISLEFILN